MCCTTYFEYTGRCNEIICEWGNWTRTSFNPETNCYQEMRVKNESRGFNVVPKLGNCDNITIECSDSETEKREDCKWPKVKYLATRWPLIVLLFVASRDYFPSILNWFSGISGGGGNIHTSPPPTTRPSITTEAPTTACESLFHCWLKFIISLTKGYHFIQRSASKHVQSRRRVLVCNCGEPLGLTSRQGREAYKTHSQNLYERNKSHVTWTTLHNGCLIIHEFQCCLIAVQPATYVSLGCFADLGERPRPLPILIANKRHQIDWYNLKKTVQACAEEARQRRYESCFFVRCIDYCNVLLLNVQHHYRHLSSSSS